MVFGITYHTKAMKGQENDVSMAIKLFILITQEIYYIEIEFIIIMVLIISMALSILLLFTIYIIEL